MDTRKPKTTLQVDEPQSFSNLHGHSQHTEPHLKSRLIQTSAHVDNDAKEEGSPLVTSASTHQMKVKKEI
jgi:hypothetical protein